MIRRSTSLALVVSWLLLVNAAAGSDPAILSLRSDTQTVGQFEKFELRLDLQADYTNPFDPEQIDLWAEFVAPSGKTYRSWGFYHPSSWSSLWMIRFAPPETGQWKYVVHVATGDDTVHSDTHTFTAVPSTHHGFVTVAANQRFLKYTDGSPFYGVGLWYNDSYELFDQGGITEAALDDLQQRGVNFISFFPTPLETMGTGLGRYDQNRCGRLDQIFEWCEARDIHISWNVWFHSYLSEAVWGGGNARYRNNPYRLITPAVDFYGSQEAWEYQQRLYRYMIARWGYSRSLFLWFVIDEINGTEGWTQGDQTVAEQWSRKVHEYFRQHDPYGRPTTGTQSGGIGQWWPGGYAIFDIAAREIYEAQGHPMPRTGKPDLLQQNPLRDSYHTYATQLQSLWRGFHKPAVIGECGWDHTYYEPGMPGYLAMYHNVLWVSLANGACTTPFWWAHSERLNDSVVTNQLQSFAQFVSDIDFAASDWEPAELSAGVCDAWALHSPQLLFGWAVHPTTSIANETITIAGLPDGDYRVQLYRTWRGTYLEPQQVTATEGKLTFQVPELRTTGGHALHIGQDVAFKVRRIRPE